MKITSNGKWTKIGESQDTNRDFEAAKAIACALVERWGITKPPCEIRGHCTDSWVEQDGKVVWSYFGGIQLHPQKRKKL